MQSDLARLKQEEQKFIEQLHGGEQEAKRRRVRNTPSPVDEVAAGSQHIDEQPDAEMIVRFFVEFVPFYYCKQ